MTTEEAYKILGLKTEGEWGRDKEGIQETWETNTYWHFTNGSETSDRTAILKKRD